MLFSLSCFKTYIYFYVKKLAKNPLRDNGGGGFKALADAAVKVLPLLPSKSRAPHIDLPVDLNSELH